MSRITHKGDGGIGQVHTVKVARGILHAIGLPCIVNGKALCGVGEGSDFGDGGGIRRIKTHQCPWGITRSTNIIEFAVRRVV